MNRKRATNAIKDHEEKEDLTARWKSAHDACSLAACNTAFEDSKDDEGYDLGIEIIFLNLDLSAD